jgi:hypothetical protein
MRSLVPLLSTAVLLSGCVGAGTMRTLAPDAGAEVRYAVPVDTLLAALPGALERRGLHPSAPAPFDSATTMLIASKSAGLFSWGGLLRVLASPTSGGQSSARVVARSRSALDWSGAVDRVAPRAIEALDASLGPAALGPFPGMRVRGRADGGTGPFLRGTVVTGPDGALRLAPDGTAGDTSIRLAMLRDVAVFRGAYTHRWEGANIGGFGGLVAGAIIGAAAASEGERGQGASIGMLIGVFGGMLVGSGVGAAIRSEIWSPVSPPPDRPPR